MSTTELSRLGRTEGQDGASREPDVTVKWCPVPPFYIWAPSTSWRISYQPGLTWQGYAIAGANRAALSRGVALGVDIRAASCRLGLETQSLLVRGTAAGRLANATEIGWRRNQERMNSVAQPRRQQSSWFRHAAGVPDPNQRARAIAVVSRKEWARWRPAQSPNRNRCRQTEFDMVETLYERPYRGARGYARA
jgi:hypothetical protein